MKQKGLIRSALFVLLLSPLLFADDSYWLKLLHFKNGHSEIDDPSFFLAKNGKTDPISELNATIEAIKSDENISCKYPARVEYLYEKYPDLLKDTPKRTCKKVEELLDEISPKKLILVFPTAHINSPASMFGHSFLVVRGDEVSPLMANAINYAANSAETNGLFFAYYGLTGGYEGRYSALPYYKKIKEYSNLESRDIWEYELDLKAKEIRRMLLHIYELKDHYSKYYFFTKNCSYELLWLLEVARADLKLTDKFSYKAIPIDTIKAIKKKGLITKSSFRPSQNRKIKALIEAKKKARGDLKRAYEAELEVKRLKLQRKAKDINSSVYKKELIRVLKKRASLPKTPTPKITTPVNPLNSHKSTRVDLGVGDSGYELGFKAAFHDIYDLDLGFSEGAYIDFFHLDLLYDWDGKLHLRYFDFVKISSYTPMNEMFKSPSWGVRAGFEEFRGLNYFVLDGEIGATGKFKNWLFYLEAKPSIHLRDRAVWGVAPKVGAFANFHKLKLGLSLEKTYFDDGKSSYFNEAFITFSLTNDLSLNLKLDDDRIKKDVSARLFYYF